MAVVGIDLGTTNTVIAAVRDGRATALKDKLGRALLPSVVSFSPSGKRKVGYEAKDRRTIDPENTVFSTKRLIGRPFDSEHVKKAISRLPFELKEGPGKSTLVSCYGVDYTLPEISAMVLEQAQLIGQARLGTDVSDAVITVPANFNDLQRAATKVAGRTAGLEVLRIINEPTAAALAYGFGKTNRERIAVYDFGGGTFDVTLLDLSDNVFEVLATAGDTFLGGDDIDRAIMDRMAEDLLKKNKVDANADNLVREQLRAAAERLKIDLSTRSMGKTRIEELDFEFTLRRSEFEKLTEPLLKRTLEVCQEAMDVAGVANKDLDQILLVGGSTRIPLVRRRVSSFFGKMPQSRINPDEVVAIGAAIQASSLEAKQGPSASLPAAPRARVSASQHPSRAPMPLGSAQGTTKTGLAGLKATLAGPGPSEVPGRLKASTLTGIKSVPPIGQRLGPASTLGARFSGSEHPSSPPVGALSPAPRGKHKTLAGVGGDDEPRAKMGTLAGVGEKKGSTLAGLTDRPKGNTNLGLGATPSSPPPVIGRPPPTARHVEPSFDDETSVNEGAALIAAELDKRASAIKEESRGKFATLPGAAAPPGGESESTTDGSVTFDLAELERLHEEDIGFEDLENEATAVVDADQVAARAAQLDSQVDHDLPAPLRNEPEEIGGSALIALSDEEDEIADLPVARGPVELGGSALIDLTEDDEEQIDLPSRTANISLNKTEIGLQPSARVRDDLPELLAEEAGLPVVSADVPIPAAHLPAPTRDLPAPTRDLPALGGPLAAKPSAALPRTKSGELRLGLGKTLAFTPGDGPDFASATDGAPTPSVQELDELSVAALLPDDEDDSAEFELSHPGLDSLSSELGRATFPHASPSAAESPRIDAPNLGALAAGTARVSTLEDSVASALSQPPAALPQVPMAAPRAPLLLDVTPLSLGVEVIGGYVDTLIERNSPIPCENTRTFATARDNQAMVRVRVSQGEAERFDRNTLLGEVELTGLSQGPRGSVKVDVSFSLDESGMLQVSARDTATGKAADARLMLVGVAPTNH